MNLTMKSKILLVEIMEALINDKRFILPFEFISEVIKLLLGMSIHVEHRTRISKTLLLLILLFLVKIGFKIESSIFMRMYSVGFISFHSHFYSLLVAMLYLFSEYSNRKYTKSFHSFKKSDSFIFLMILLTPNHLMCITPFVFIKPEYFTFAFIFYFLFKYLFCFIFFLFVLRFVLQRHKLCKDLKIAFIADGNRRYLKNNNLSEESVKSQGIYKIYEITRLCEKLGVKEVGFYCFSIKNFNRPKSEIKNIMSVISDGKYKFQVDNLKMRFRVYGRLNMLSKEVQKELNDLVESTKNNKDITVNLFIAYSTSDELENGILFDEDVDLLVRTSGEKRLSDFLIRQCARGTNIFFASPLWPELSILHLFLILIKYKLEMKFFISK